jgi:hypothetical protein
VKRRSRQKWKQEQVDSRLAWMAMVEKDVVVEPCSVLEDCAEMTDGVLMVKVIVSMAWSAVEADLLVGVMIRSAGWKWIASIGGILVGGVPSYES